MKIYRERQLGVVEGAFYTLIMWGVVSILTILATIIDVFIAYPLSLVLKKGAHGLVHFVSNYWARGIIKWNPLWSLVVTGTGNIKKGQRYIVISNHQSLLDILVVLAAIPTNFKFLAKKELFYVPFMGWAMAAAGYIPLNRTSRESARKAIKNINEVLAKGMSILLFPEGTRSLDGKIHAFKTGAFKIARENNVEILPVVVEGTGNALPKKTLFLRKRTKFIASIGKPVSLADLNGRSLDDVKEEIRHEMAGRLAKIKKTK